MKKSLDEFSCGHKDASLDVKMSLIVGSYVFRKVAGKGRVCGFVTEIDNTQQHVNLIEFGVLGSDIVENATDVTLPYQAAVLELTVIDDEQLLKVMGLMMSKYLKARRQQKAHHPPKTQNDLEPTTQAVSIHDNQPQTRNQTKAAEVKRRVLKEDEEPKQKRVRQIAIKKSGTKVEPGESDESDDSISSQASLEKSPDPTPNDAYTFPEFSEDAVQKADETSASERISKYITGLLSQDEQECFAKLTKAERRRYAVGRSFSKSDFQGREGNSTQGMKTMCCFYRSDCASKTYQYDKIISQPAEYVHITQLSNLKLRHLPTVGDSGANSKLKFVAYCLKCKNEKSQLQSEDVFNVLQHSEVCIICKQLVSSGKSHEGIPLCSNCERKMKLTNKEEIIRRTLGPVIRAFRLHNLVLQDTNRTAVVAQGQRYYIDICVYGRYESAGKVYNILYIIESDQNQHKNQQKGKKERDKLLLQTVAKAVQKWRDMDVKDLRVVMIRFNPDSRYNLKHKDANDIDVHIIYRLVVLRQWIIWHLINITTVRNVFTWYFYYDEKRKHEYLFQNDDGFALIFNAPQPEVPSHNWKYCMDPVEGTNMGVKRGCKENNIKNDIINNRVDVNVVMPSWKMENSKIPELFLENYMEIKLKSR